MLEKIWNIVKDKANVIGYSKELKPRIKNGKIIEGTKVFRVYVSKKMPKHQLHIKDIIPQSVILSNEEIEIDVVEIGEIKALSTVDKTKKFRPVKLGVSVGHWNITAGSLGMLYRDSYGNIFAGSNAHVLTDDPSKHPNQMVEKRILQPGAYHGGRNEENVVGYYVWHQRIVPLGESNCSISKGIVKVLNSISKLLGRKSRFKVISTKEHYNKIDFAVYQPIVKHDIEVADGSLSKDDPFIGHLFAGSDMTGVICKVKYIIEKGYYPLINYTEVKDGDTVKGCSFWCNYKTTITDSSAVVRVSYGDYIATFDDVIIVHNDGTIKGGWSGSGWRKIGE